MPTNKLITITVKTCRVIDGDSMDVMFDHGRKVYSESGVRLAGLDTPESRGVSEMEKACGLKVKKAVELWFKKLQDSNKQIMFLSYEWEEKFGRLVGDFREQTAGHVETLGEYLLRNKLARPYHGEKKIDWTKEELRLIEVFEI